MHQLPATNFDGDQVMRAMTGAASSPAPDRKRMTPETRLIHLKWAGSKKRNSNPSPKLSASHHNSEPSQTPSTRIAARPSVALSPPRPTAANIPTNARIVIGLVSVSAKVDR